MLLQFLPVNLSPTEDYIYSLEIINETRISSTSIEFNYYLESVVSEMEMDIVDLIPPSPCFTCPPSDPQAAVLTGGGSKTLIPTGRNKAAALNIQCGNPVSGALQKFNAGRMMFHGI